MGKHILAAVLAVLFMASGAQAAGNVWNDSFNKAKKTLEWQDHALLRGRLRRKEGRRPAGRLHGPEARETSRKDRVGACGPG